MLAFILLIITLVAISLRQQFFPKVQIWHLMLTTALVCLLTASITVPEALAAIDWQILVFLAGMFIIGEALYQSGLVARVSSVILPARLGSAVALLVFMLFSGLLSALLSNDSIAILACPLALILAQRFYIKARTCLLALAFSVSIGSIFSPFGNPQNLLIALSPLVTNPFGDFLFYLLVPSLLSIVAAWLVLLVVMKKDFLPRPLMSEGLEQTSEPTSDSLPLKVQAKVSSSLVSLILLLALLGWQMAATFVPQLPLLPLWSLSITAAVPVMLFYPERKKLAKAFDWQTLVFFAALFIAVETVWASGFLTDMVQASGIQLEEPLTLFGFGLVLSQVVSNVPLVALVLPLLESAHAPAKLVMVLAAGSTLAGNLTILGAASNVILLQKAAAESAGKASFNMLDMLKTGPLITLVSTLIFFAWWAIV